MAREDSLYEFKSEHMLCWQLFTRLQPRIFIAFETLKEVSKLSVLRVNVVCLIREHFGVEIVQITETKTFFLRSEIATIYCV